MVHARGDRAVAELAACQHGAVAHGQLLAAGLGAGAIAYRVQRGRLHRVFRGVYLVGHPIAPVLGREAAAVLACGEGAMLSHRTAAVIWGFLPGPLPALVDVVVPDSDCGVRPGIRHHRTRTLDPATARLRDGIPIVPPARALVEVAQSADGATVARALEELLLQRLATTAEVADALVRAPRRRGVAVLRRLLDKAHDPRLTRSEAERRLLELVRDARLPEPQTNARLGRYEVDFLWRDERLALEVDGFAFHSSRAAFERDRRRDADIQALGFRVLRVTWRQLVDEPAAVVARIATLLAQR